MSFYDYIPVVGSVARAAQGDWGHAAADLTIPTSLMYSGAQAIHGANTQQKNGYLTAADQARTLGQQQQQFQMQGLDKAEGYYAPARARLQAAYGDPGSVR